ncbi:hypothetical protein C7S18_04255 [Ahniella affigens]|uniref:Lipoprotein n=1 Tax=Ahniella affigens TaxID=2021234 RepID=A0A2P1PNN2_9GAMM|nr:hypothetical protein [Ahniella affigens]AVP96454.1 hypothetical protein C7S18_04255 [Ahniella affigens]
MITISKAFSRQWPLWIGLAGLTACQTPPERDTPPSPTPANLGAVSGNVLDAPASQRYQPATQERYEQPTPDPDNPAPIYPVALLAEALPPVVVRVRVIVGAGGSVQQVEPIAQDAGQAPAFFEATRLAVMQWFYLPLVRIRPSQAFSTLVDDRGTEVLYQGDATALPFHLDYEFVFRQEHGKGQVDSRTDTAASVGSESP